MKQRLRLDRGRGFAAGRLMLALALAAIPAARAGAAGAAANAQIKAVMIYNIIRFMALPEPHARLRLCVKAGDDITTQLAALEGQPVGKGSLDVVASGDGQHGCDVAYAGPGALSPRETPAHGQITIGEGASFAENGGTVGLINFGGQLRFVINARAATRAGVTVNSQLMRLAARVIN